MKARGSRGVAARAILLALAAAVALGAVAPAARAQGSRKDDIVFGPSGHPIAGATITVCQSTATGTPCSPLAAVYTDATLTVVAPNPFQGDGIGNYHFYAPAGRYMVQITGPGISGAITYHDVILPADTSSSGAGNNISAFSLTLGGNLSVAGNANVSGTLTTTNFNPGSFTPSSLNVSGNASLGGPRPWVDVTASPYGAKGDGVTDDTAAIQSAINAVCNASTGLTGGGIIYFPAQGAAGYAVKQAQGGSGSLAPVFTIPCGGLTFRGGGQRGASGQQFVRSPATAINVVTLGSNPSAGPIFCLNGCGGSNPNNSITFEDLVLAGYNQALYNFATNTNLRNVFLKNQATGFTGSGTTYTDNVALVQKGFWFEWTDGVLFGNALMPVDNSGGGPYDQTVENIQLNGSQFIVDVRQNFAAGVQGTWFFQNVTRENATAGQDFIFLVNHTGNNCGTTALPGGISDITIDHFLDADASPTTMAIVHSDATMAGCLIKDINIRNSEVGNAGAGLAIEMSGGTLQGSVIVGNAGSTAVVDGNGNPTGGAQIVTNGNGNDAFVFTGNDDPRGSPIPRRLSTDVFIQGASGNPPAPGWALTASGNQQRSLAGDPVAGVLFGSGVDYGYTENISQTTREALDIGFATVTPPSSFAGSATTGGSLVAGTYFYSIRANTGGNCSTSTSDSAPAIITTGIVVGGSNNAVALTWTPVAGTSPTAAYCIQRQTGNANLFQVSTGFQISAPASSYTDTGANPSPWSSGQSTYTNPMASAHRFTPTSLGVNTTNPQFNLDVNGSAAVNSLNGVAKAERFAGADAAAQINACLTAAQSAGTVCDARGLKGTLTGAHHITIPAGTVLLWGQAQLTVNDTTTNDAVELTGDGASILGYQESGINTLPNTDTAGYIACGVAGCTTVRNPNKATGKINFVHIDGMYLLATGASSTVVDMTSIGHSTVENNSIVLGTGGNSFGIFGDTSTGNQDSTNTKFYHNNIEPQGAGDTCLSLAGVFNAVVVEQNTCILPHVGSTVIGFQFKKDSNANYPNNDEIYGNDCESANPSVGQICYNVVGAKSVTFGPNNRCEKVYACFQSPSDGSATGIHFVDHISLFEQHDSAQSQRAGSRHGRRGQHQRQLAALDALRFQRFRRAEFAGQRGLRELAKRDDARLLGRRERGQYQSGGQRNLRAEFVIQLHATSRPVHAGQLQRAHRRQRHRGPRHQLRLRSSGRHAELHARVSRHRAHGNQFPPRLSLLQRRELHGSQQNHERRHQRARAGSRQLRWDGFSGRRGERELAEHERVAHLQQWHHLQLQRHGRRLAGGRGEHVVSHAQLRHHVSRSERRIHHIRVRHRRALDACLHPRKHGRKSESALFRRRDFEPGRDLERCASRRARR